MEPHVNRDVRPIKNQPTKHPILGLHARTRPLTRMTGGGMLCCHAHTVL